MNRETPTDGTAPDTDELKEMLNNLYGVVQHKSEKLVQDVINRIMKDRTFDIKNATGSDTDRLKEMLNGILRQRQEIKRMMKRDNKIRTILE